LSGHACIRRASRDPARLASLLLLYALSRPFYFVPAGFNWLSQWESTNARRHHIEAATDDDAPSPPLRCCCSHRAIYPVSPPLRFTGFPRRTGGPFLARHSRPTCCSPSQKKRGGIGRRPPLYLDYHLYDGAVRHASPGNPAVYAPSLSLSSLRYAHCFAS